MSWSSLTGATRTSAIAAILGFFLSVTWTGTTSIDGQITCAYNDFAAFGLGILAVLAGGTGLVRAGALPAGGRMANIGLCAAGAAVGVLHIFRGLGMVGGPCAGL